MLKRIRLENFKSWKELDIELAPLTLLFGTNSSGKTSILQSLLLLKQTVNSIDPGEHINFGGEHDFVDLGSYREIVLDHNQGRHLGIGVDWVNLDENDNQSVPLQMYSYRAQWEQSQDRVGLALLSYSSSQTLGGMSAWPAVTVLKTSANSYTYSLPNGWELLPGDRPGPESCYIIPYSVAASFPRADQKNHKNFYASGYFAPFDYSQEFKLMMDQIYYLGPLREYPKRTYLWQGTQSQSIGPRGQNTLNALIASVRESVQRSDLILAVAAWLDRLGLAVEFKLSAIDQDRRFYEPRVTTYSEAGDSSLLDAGFGISQVLPVLTLLFLAPTHSIILIEQPELHLHPNAQAQLADLFLHVARTRNLQIIIESHSEHLLRRIQRRIAEPKDKFATPENIRAYFCEPGSEGSSIREVKVDEYGDRELA